MANNYHSFVLVDTKPMNIWQSDLGKYVDFKDLLYAIFGSDKGIARISADLSFTNKIEVINFKMPENLKKRQYLFPLSELAIYKTRFPNNQILAELSSALVHNYPPRTLVSMRNFCYTLKRDYNIDIGRNKLLELLRDNSFLMKDRFNKNVPTQYSLNNNLFEMIWDIQTIKNCYNDYYYHCYPTPYLTDNGLKEITDFMLKEIEGI